MPPKRMRNAAIERMITDRVDAAIAAERIAITVKAAEVARAAAAAKTTRAAATAGGAESSNNARPAAGVGGPNVAGPTIGAVAMNVVPEVRGCSYKEFMSYQPTNFKGTKGVVGLTRWFERSESVFLISKCVENDKVKYATSTLLDEALSWWNSVAQPIGIENDYKIPWVELKKMMIKLYCPHSEVQKLEVELWNHMVKGVDITTYNFRFQELVILCPAMVPTTEKLLESYVWGLSQPIQGNENARGYATAAAALYIKKGCYTFLAHITKKKSEEKRLDDVPIIRDFPIVFPEDLLGLPPPRQVEFQIELVLGATPVAQAPYRLAPSEMQELSNQLQELTDKGFIRPSSSPWGAPILFVKKRTDVSGCASTTGS
ncbi:reverse transcriptase domain-containing protein [Tanacetum coccineum]